MNDKKKTKEQLIRELKTLRWRFAEFEKEKRAQSEAGTVRISLEHALRERIKDLSCLYRIAEMIEQHSNSTENILQAIADLLPPAWQYPEITCSRIVFENKKYVSAKFKNTKWKQTADIKVGNKKAGTVEVYYLEKKPILDEGPFLKEERLLINAVAERIGRAAERIQAEQQLEMERTALNNMNIALREVLGKMEEERKEIGSTIQANVDKVIMPILLALEKEVPIGQQAYVALLRKNLEEITSPFTSKLLRAFMSLTPVEVQTCNMIKNGLSTKEIARLRNISPSTVNRHREHIRRKLGITNKDVNLASYLLNFMS